MGKNSTTTYRKTSLKKRGVYDYNTYVGRVTTIALELSNVRSKKFNVQEGIVGENLTQK